MSTRMQDREPDVLFRAGRYLEASEKLRQGLEKQGVDGKDLLLYLLDTALALHAAGEYEESNRFFLKADKIAEIKDYTSLAAESATLLISDNSKDYPGEDFEKVLISTYLAMNYALLGENEDAIVEAKRVNRKLQLMITEGERKYKQSAFARYLSALLYEDEGEISDAYLDYKWARDLDSQIPGIGMDLWSSAWRLGMSDEMKRWETTYSLDPLALAEIKKKGKKFRQAEIVVLYENGISPRKVPHESWHSIPRFVPRSNPVRTSNFYLSDQKVGTSYVLENIEAKAIENLNEKYGKIIAKKVAGVVVKEVVGNQIERATGSRALGTLAKLILYASDQADLRSWNLLPRDLQILRIRVEPGLHELRWEPIGGGASQTQWVQVEKNEKVFVNFRYMP
jgi:hypothetical protein